MVTEKHVFIASDGTEYEYRWQAEQHDLHADIKYCINQGCVGFDEFDSDVALKALLAKYDLTKKQGVVPCPV